MKRNIPELKFNNTRSTVLAQFAIYDKTKSVPETPKEKEHWKRGYICALLDTKAITKIDWDILADDINHPKEGE